MTLPSAGSGYTPWSLAVRLAFSRDRRSLLSIPTERGKGATVWDVAGAKLIRTFEGDFAAEAFFPDGRRVIGMTGPEVVVRDVATGAIVERWPMPDGLVSALEKIRSLSFRPNAFHADVPSLCVSPDGHWVAAFGLPHGSDIGMPTAIFLFDAGSGRLRGASRWPLTGPATPRAARPLGWRSTPRAACSRWRPPGISPSTRFPRASRSARRRWPGPISRLLVRPLRMEACRSSRCPPASRSRREARDCTWPRTRAMRTVTPSPE